MLRELLSKSKLLNLDLDQATAQKLIEYLDLVRKWNKVHNLCADASYQQMLYYHILDSISVSGSINLKHKTILDVGTGAGLPGIPLAIVEPSCKVVLLDSKIKKITFVNHAINILNLNNAAAEAARVEKYNSEFKFDIIISRAFADLTKFVEFTRHLSAPNGIIIAMKSDPEPFVIGSDVGGGYSISEVKNLNIPGVIAKRCLVVVRK